MGQILPSLHRSEPDAHLLRAGVSLAPSEASELRNDSGQRRQQPARLKIAVFPFPGVGECAMAAIGKPSGYHFDVPRVRGGRFDVRSEQGRAVFDLFDVVGGERVNEDAVAEALKSAGEMPVTVRINSPGGDFHVGNTIYNLLRGHRPGVVVQVLGLAASAASVIAMAGSRIEIARSAEIMVHRAWLVAIGNAETMAEAGAILRQIDEAIADIYVRRTGQKAERVRELMAAETFMAADQAIEMGFADRMLPQDAVAKLEPEAGPPPDVRAFEAELRSLGFSKAAAERVALAGWRAIGNETYADLVGRMERQTAELRAINERNTR